MVTQRQRQLADLVHANAQRREREELLGSLEQRIQAQLARAECVYSPAADNVLRRVLPISGEQVGAAASATLPDFQFVTTGKSHRVFEHLRNPFMNSEFEPAVLVLPGVNRITYDGDHALVPKYPLFRMRFGEAQRILATLWLPSSDFCAVFADDLTAGIIVDSYGEYPEEDAGIEETTYEVATWGHCQE